MFLWRFFKNYPFLGFFSVVFTVTLCSISYIDFFAVSHVYIWYLCTATLFFTQFYYRNTFLAIFTPWFILFWSFTTSWTYMYIYWLDIYILFCVFAALLEFITGILWLRQARILTRTWPFSGLYAYYTRTISLLVKHLAKIIYVKRP